MMNKSSLILFLFCPLLLIAQEQDFQQWSKIGVSYDFNKDLSVSLDQAIRFRENASLVDVTFNNLSLKSEKINLLGISQGGLLARCYVEKYSNLVKPVHSLITYGTPHMGIYNSLIELKRLEYWKNPFKYQEYLQTNDFLAYINNIIYILNFKYIN